MNVFYVESFYSLSTSEQNRFFNFCVEESSDSDHPAAVNMARLQHTLTETNRFFVDGDFFILYDNGNVIGCGGVYESDFCNGFALAGVRTWMTKTYRNKSLVRQHLLPAHKQWSLKKGYIAVGLSFNDYNANIIHTFKRKRFRETIKQMPPRKRHHLFYNGIHEVGFPVTIKNTPQYVIYEKLDPHWEYNWELIRSKQPLDSCTYQQHMMQQTPLV